VNGGDDMADKRFIFKGAQFHDVNIKPVCYDPSFFQMELDLESDVFHELRLANGISPAKINESSGKVLEEIKNFFIKNRDTFYFLFIEDGQFIGSILYFDNYIQSLSVARKFQRQGYGEKLSKYCINRILENGYDCVELNVLHGNSKAEKLYRKLGFKEIAS
jgi:RimJ/RimL family protein N-acetyltransferase